MPKVMARWLRTSSIFSVSYFYFFIRPTVVTIRLFFFIFHLIFNTNTAANSISCHCFKVINWVIIKSLTVAKYKISYLHYFSVEYTLLSNGTLLSQNDRHAITLDHTTHKITTWSKQKHSHQTRNKDFSLIVQLMSVPGTTLFQLTIRIQ